MQLIELISDSNIVIFFLLFARVGGVMAFFPFYSYSTIPVSIKTALAFYLTIIFISTATLTDATLTLNNITVYILLEFMFGLIAGLALQFIFASLSLAGQQISMVMGFSMATVFDPTTGTSSPIIAKSLGMFAIIMLLAFNGHHLILLFLNDSIINLKLGAFYPEPHIWDYMSEAVKHMFIMGFVIAFPIMTLSILADVIFGMLMKSMPQFNLLVVGFPIKIFLSYMVFIGGLGSILSIFKLEFIGVLTFLESRY
jgi:flagellar biosynthetic protein FliR